MVNNPKRLGDLEEMLQEALTCIVPPAQDICFPQKILHSQVNDLPVHAVHHVYQQLNDLGADLRQDNMSELPRLKTQTPKDRKFQGEEQAVDRVKATFLILKDSIGL